MKTHTHLTFVHSTDLLLTSRCRNRCSYCGLSRRGIDLLPVAAVREQVRQAATRGCTEVVLMTGEGPSDYPETHLALAREALPSFAAYLAVGCRAVLDHGMLPVVAAGALEAHEIETLSPVVGMLRIDVAAEGSPHQPPHGAHQESRGRRLEPAHRAIRTARDAGVPVSLGLICGIETDDERLRLLDTVAGWFIGDGQLEEIRLVTIVPHGDCAQPDRPPLGTEPLAAFASRVRSRFPGLPVSISPALRPDFKPLAAAGIIDDLGSVAFGQPIPAAVQRRHPTRDVLAAQARAAGFALAERVPAGTTTWNTGRPDIGAVLAGIRLRLQPLATGVASLADNGRCFVCGPENPAGLRLDFEVAGENRVRAVVALPPTYQGYAEIAHGGILATLLDEAMAKAILAGGARPVTAEMTVRFLHPAPIGIPLIVEGWIEQRRRRMTITSATLAIDGGRILCEATGRYLEPAPRAAGATTASDPAA